MPVRLRGHHFLCMLTYKGLGYTPAFVTNMDMVIARIGAGAPVSLVEGPDAICAGLTKACTESTGHDCRDPQTTERDRQAVADTATLLGRAPGDGRPIAATDILMLRMAFRAGSVRKACAACPWSETCSAIAADYAGVRLRPDLVP